MKCYCRPSAVLGRNRLVYENANSCPTSLSTLVIAWPRLSPCPIHSPAEGSRKWGVLTALVPGGLHDLERGQVRGLELGDTGVLVVSKKKTIASNNANYLHFSGSDRACLKVYSLTDALHHSRAEFSDVVSAMQPFSIKSAQRATILLSTVMNKSLRNVISAESDNLCTFQAARNFLFFRSWFLSQIV